MQSRSRFASGPFPSNTQLEFEHTIAFFPSRVCLTSLVGRPDVTLMEQHRPVLPHQDDR